MRLAPLALHEIEWVRAANTLDKIERTAAIMQIAKMTGFGIAELAREANRIRLEQRAKARRVIASARPIRPVLVPERTGQKRGPIPGPDPIRQPTKAQLMGAR